MPPPMHMVTTPILGAAAAAFDQDMAGQARARHAIGMADGNGAAIHIGLGRIEPQLVHAIERLAGKGLVQFPQVDVVDLQAMALQQARHRLDGADAHFVRLDAGDGEAA